MAPSKKIKVVKVKTGYKHSFVKSSSGVATDTTPTAPKSKGPKSMIESS